LAAEAAVAVRDLFVREENEVIRHAMKPIIPAIVTRKTPAETAAGTRCCD
jgi:hypothetical protein